MKKIIRALCVALLLTLLIAAMTVCAYADEAALYTGTMLGTGEKNTGVGEKVSYGLDVVAADNRIEFAGVMGYALNFSADKFACALNLSNIETIEIVELPPSDEGTLYFGSTCVSANQTISKNSIELLSFESTGKNDIGEASEFKIRVNGSAYSIVCGVYMLEKINSSPTIATAPAISLVLETYRGVSAGGVLCGYDLEGDTLTYEIVSYPVNGYIMVVDKNSGEYVYTPASGYSGKDEFSYVVKDVYGNYSSSATVSINVATPYSNVVYNDLLGNENYSYALNMTDKNVMNGEKVGDYYYFRPDATVSRVDFIVSAMKVLGIESIPDAESTVFADDADIGNEVRGYISLAYSNKYISGIEEGGQLYLKPNDNITLSEAAVIISNIIGYSDYSTAPTFANGDEIPSWSKQAVMSLRALGVIEAPSNSNFENSLVDRGCMAKLLSRAVWVTENI